LRATKAGIKNTYTFDLGIPGWAEQYPDKVILLGKVLSESNIAFISNAKFLKKTLPWPDFKKMSAGRGIKVIDTRDIAQKGYMRQADEDKLSREELERLIKFRSGNRDMLLELGKTKVMSQSFDMLKRNVIGNKRYQHQTLLIFDQVGKQVRWLMYHLEAAGMKKYYFLEKGANGVIGIQAYGKL